nr:hypothetical protein [uncultured bacterium]
MKPTSIAIVAVTVVALSASIGSAWYLDAREPRKPYPKATPPPDPSPVYTPSDEPVLSEEEIEKRAEDHNAMLARNIEAALLGRDAERREMAFTFLVPELLDLGPELLVDLHSRQKPGEARDTLRTELARQWVARDRDAAVKWMKSLDDEERERAAKEAVDALSVFAPDQAILVADEMGIGRGDGYLERLVQSWAEADLEGAEAWLASQPDDARTAPLRARIEQVRERQKDDEAG